MQRPPGLGSLPYPVNTNQRMTLTKAELVEQLTDDIGLNRGDAKRMVEAFYEEVTSALAQGDEVKFSGFGVFSLREKPPRPGRNPKTGEDCPISARRVVTFSASPKLKDAVICIQKRTGVAKKSSL